MGILKDATIFNFPAILAASNILRSEKKELLFKTVEKSSLKHAKESFKDMEIHLQERKKKLEEYQIKINSLKNQESNENLLQTSDLSFKSAMSNQ